jgi:hypothetical protein
MQRCGKEADCCSMCRDQREGREWRFEEDNWTVMERPEADASAPNSLAAQVLATHDWHSRRLSGSSSSSQKAAWTGAVVTRSFSPRSSRSFKSTDPCTMRNGFLHQAPPKLRYNTLLISAGAEIYGKRPRSEEAGSEEVIKVVRFTEPTLRLERIRFRTLLHVSFEPGIPVTSRPSRR